MPCIAIVLGTLKVEACSACLLAPRLFGTSSINRDEPGEYSRTNQWTETSPVKPVKHCSGISVE